MILAAVSHGFRLDLENDETKKVIEEEFSILMIQQTMLYILSMFLLLIWMNNLIKMKLKRLFVIIIVFFIQLQFPFYAKHILPLE